MAIIAIGCENGDLASQVSATLENLNIATRDGNDLHHRAVIAAWPRELRGKYSTVTVRKRAAKQLGKLLKAYCEKHQIPLEPSDDLVLQGMRIIKATPGQISGLARNWNPQATKVPENPVIDLDEEAVDGEVLRRGYDALARQGITEVCSAGITRDGQLKRLRVGRRGDDKETIKESAEPDAAIDVLADHALLDERVIVKEGTQSTKHMLTQGANCLVGTTVGMASSPVVCTFLDGDLAPTFFPRKPPGPLWLNPTIVVAGMNQRERLAANLAHFPRRFAFTFSALPGGSTLDAGTFIVWEVATDFTKEGRKTLRANLMPGALPPKARNALPIQPDENRFTDRWKHEEMAFSCELPVHLLLDFERRWMRMIETRQKQAKDVVLKLGADAITVDEGLHRPPLAHRMLRGSLPECQMLTADFVRVVKAINELRTVESVVLDVIEEMARFTVSRPEAQHVIWMPLRQRHTSVRSSSMVRPWTLTWRK
ncbi:hypothetical protein [Roseicella aerolata]|uniref:Uncharacterized protein n=1 Tax=Roseicella aerolata TaxID=2883479 RepID=A0A9X1IJ71_9PROT|nr:hypothetical protein [Roseicella aerolata]MCB4825527.1 hypothetical protein [Roseicella aerolata]